MRVMLASQAAGTAWRKQGGQWVDCRGREPVTGEVCWGQISGWGSEIKRWVGVKSPKEEEVVGFGKEGSAWSISSKFCLEPWMV